MRVTVGYSGESAELDVLESRLAGSWHGPTQGIDPRTLRDQVGQALEHPVAYPPLRQCVVPGDRVVIAIGAGVPEADAILAVVLDVLRGAGVEPGDITLLAPSGTPALAALDLPAGVTRLDHDPDDHTRLAYLASTSEGRRVYLDRLLTDADVVLPIGRLTFDPILGYGGPWGAIFPGLSDRDTLVEAAASAMPAFPEPDTPPSLFSEAAEVSWLLGSLFHLAVAPGPHGVMSLLAGREDVVRDEGLRLIQDHWTVTTDAEVELVLAGIGLPGVPTTLDDLSLGLQSAHTLIRPGGAGRIVALSTIAELPERPDKPVTERLDRVLEGAAVYLLSRLDPDVVEELGMVPVGDLADAQRLIAASDSYAVLSPADLLRIARPPG